MSTSYRKKVAFRKTGLVCSGGATKAAAFHLGVCLALRDKGFTFVGGKLENPAPKNALPYPPPKYHPQEIATYVGSSAGAFIAATLASGLPIESIIDSFSPDDRFRTEGDHPEIPRISYREMLHLNWPRPSRILSSFRKNSVFADSVEALVLKNLRLPGLFSTKGFANYLKKNILPTDYFSELKANLFVVGTQLDHSRKIIFGRFGTVKTFDEYCQYSANAKISDAVAASMTLPPIFAPYLIKHFGGQERYYIDGEIRETMSTHVAKENDCDLIICSYTHQPYHYNPEIGSLINFGISAVVIQAVYQAIEQKVYGAKKAHENKMKVLTIVRNFFEKKKYPEEHLAELMAELEDKLDFKESLNYIFIHPESNDTEMFFGEHFTLNAKTLQKVVTIGYKRAISELRKYEFQPVLTAPQAPANRQPEAS